MEKKKPINVVNADYIEGYKLEITFSDGKTSRVDFDSFFKKNSHPQYDKYKNPVLFQQFSIDMGNLVWGKDWDLNFPVNQLYRGKISD